MIGSRYVADQISAPFSVTIVEAVGGGSQILPWVPVGAWIVTRRSAQSGCSHVTLRNPDDKGIFPEAVLTPCHAGITSQVVVPI